MDTQSDAPSSQRYYGPFYGYWPSFGWIIAGITGFTLTTLLHVGQVIFYGIRRRKLARVLAAKETGEESFGREHAVTRQPKYWFIFATLIAGGTLEMVGWWGRWWSSLEHASEAEPFLMQMITLILGPCFISAFNYILLSLGVQHLGEQYSLLRAKWYVILFVMADVIGAVIQTAGAVLATNRFQDRADTTVGTNLIVAGLAIQLAAVAIFVALGADFVFRVTAERPWPRRIRQHVTLVEGDVVTRASARLEWEGDRKRWIVLLAAVFFSTLMIIMRSVYRTIEYAQSWPGYREIQYSTPDKHELYFGVFDFLPMILCLLIFNIVHPGMILSSQRLFRAK